ncbi:MAG: orotate phosphoribosyltransferase [candidate division Zixibacteria bacterium]|nr:orotate phosphoribosyltransferase [candidate division Zixibacteria bacterium]
MSNPTETVDQNEIFEIFKKSGALLKGHFLLSSGLHSDIYFEKFQVLQHPEYVEILCRKLASLFKDDNVEVVVGPTTGGVIIAYEVAKNLKTRSIFAETGDEGRIFKRGFDIKKGERTLIVDDILTTGGSIKEVIQLVKKHGGNIVGIGLLLDRSGGKVKFDYPLKALATTEVTNYRPEECPMCKRSEPLIKPGSRKMG